MIGKWQNIATEMLLRVVLIISIPFLDTMKPVVREVQIEDWKNYNYPHQTQQRVSTTSLGVFVIVYWLFVFIVCAASTYAKEANSFPRLTYWFRSPGAKNVEVAENEFLPEKKPIRKIILSEVYKLFLSLSMTCIIVMILTCMLKNMVGRPRPDFLSTCKPEGFDPDNPNYSVLGRIPVCSATNEQVVDGRRSFPSGHASYAMGVAFFTAISLYDYYLKNVFDTSYRLVISVALLIPAIWCGTSRIIDYRHHTTDVLSGLLLGALVAYTGYTCYYNIATDKQKNATAESYRDQDSSEEKNSKTLIGNKNGLVGRQFSGQNNNFLKNENNFMYTKDIV